jgi:hypothetical protein
MTTTEIASIIQLRSGTQAELDALPSGQKPLAGEPIWTTDTKQLFIGVAIDQAPVRAGSLFALMGESESGGLVSQSFRAGAQLTEESLALDAAGSGSLDVQAKRYTADHVASGANSAAFGQANRASGNSALVVGHESLATASGSTVIGRGLTNSVSQSIVMGGGGVVLRGTSSDKGWIQTIRSNASAHAVHASNIVDTCPAGSLPTGYFGFRRNGNQILIDINTDGTVRTLSLGTAT